MCRHVGYVGSPVDLAEPLLDAPHALVRQALAPRHQTSGKTNPHGSGVAWYEPGEPVPRRYRSVTPMWADPVLPALLAGRRVPAFVAAARLASPGLPVEVSGNAPFVAGHFAFSLNGSLAGFTNGVGTALRARLSPRRRAGIEGATDSEVVFAMVLDRLDAGMPPAEALAEAIHAVWEQTAARCNCILTDGQRLVATAAGNSLFTRAGWVASEPIDDGEGWTRVPDRTLLTLVADHEPTMEAL